MGVRFKDVKELAKYGVALDPRDPTRAVPIGRLANGQQCPTAPASAELNKATAVANPAEFQNVVLDCLGGINITIQPFFDPFKGRLNLNALRLGEVWSVCHTKEARDAYRERRSRFCH